MEKMSNISSKEYEMEEKTINKSAQKKKNTKTRNQNLLLTIEKTYVLFTFLSKGPINYTLHLVEIIFGAIWCGNLS